MIIDLISRFKLTFNIVGNNIDNRMCTQVYLDNSHLYHCFFQLYCIYSDWQELCHIVEVPFFWPKPTCTQEHPTVIWYQGGMLNQSVRRAMVMSFRQACIDEIRFFMSFQSGPLALYTAPLPSIYDCLNDWRNLPLYVIFTRLETVLSWDQLIIEL